MKLSALPIFRAKDILFYISCIRCIENQAPLFQVSYVVRPEVNDLFSNDFELPQVLMQYEFDEKMNFTAKLQRKLKSLDMFNPQVIRKLTTQIELIAPKIYKTILAFQNKYIVFRKYTDMVYDIPFEWYFMFNSFSGNTYFNYREDYWKVLLNYMARNNHIKCVLNAGYSRRCITLI